MRVISHMKSTNGKHFFEIIKMKGIKIKGRCNINPEEKYFKKIESITNIAESEISKLF